MCTFPCTLKANNTKYYSQTHKYSLYVRNRILLSCESWRKYFVLFCSCIYAHALLRISPRESSLLIYIYTHTHTHTHTLTTANKLYAFGKETRILNSIKSHVSLISRWMKCLLCYHSGLKQWGKDVRYKLNYMTDNFCVKINKLHPKTKLLLQAFIYYIRVYYSIAK